MHRPTLNICTVEIGKWWSVFGRIWLFVVSPLIPIMSGAPLVSIMTQSTYIQYTEYHSVSTLVGIGTLPTNPSLAMQRVCHSPPRTGGGGHHSPAGEGLGNPNSDDWRKSLALCLLCVLWQYGVWTHDFVIPLSLPASIYPYNGGSTLILDGKSMYFCESVLSGFGEELFDINPNNNNNNNNNNLFFHQSSRYIKVWLKLHEYIF
jgi:hypothetical protein